MKKVLLLLLVVLLFCVNSSVKAGDIINNGQLKDDIHRIDEVGFNILNSNGITKRTVFDYSTNNIKNACSYYRNRQIVVYRGLYYKLQSDDELAAVLSHEISHSVDSYNGIFKGYFTCFTYVFQPKKYESKADKRAIDYMVNAGYNPVAMIIVMSKAFPQERYEWCMTHSLASRRMMAVYEYIYKKYPEYLANNVYKKNPYYQNFLLTSQENREKFKNKIETNSKKSIRYQ